MNRRVLALDIGQKRTGVAISDETGIIAMPVSVIESNPISSFGNKIFEIIEEKNISQVVIGLPLNQHGEPGRDARKIQQYISFLKKRTPVPVIEWDERFTTVQAERSLLEADLSRKKRKKVIDKVAATIILQSYLDSLNYNINN